MSFFNTKNDLELARRVMLSEPDLYGAKIEHEQASATLDNGTASVANFTLDSGIVTADDVFNSASLENLYFLDDNSALCKVQIDDSSMSGNTVTFDSTAATLVSDESTACTVTDTSSYQVRVLQASSNALTFGSGTIPVGLYMGDSSEVNFNYTINEAKLKVGVPKKLRAKSTVEVEAMLEFNLAQITDPNILGAVFRGSTQGSQTNQTQYHFGFDPGEANQYMIQAFSTDKEGRGFFIEFFVCELIASAIGLGGDEFKQFGISAELLADTYRNDEADMMRSISLD